MCVYISIYLCIFSKTEHLGKAKLHGFHKEDSPPPVSILRISSHHEGSKPAVSGHYTAAANNYYRATTNWPWENVFGENTVCSQGRAEPDLSGSGENIIPLCNEAEVRRPTYRPVPAQCRKKVKSCVTAAAPLLHTHKGGGG